MTSNQVFWHRIWLIVVATLIISAYVNGFRISNVILSYDCRLATILTFVSSICLVMGIKEYAKDFFQCDKLWHASFSGFIFIGFILLIFDSIFLALTTIIIDPSVKRALCPEQMQFLLPAFSILLIVMLNGPPLFTSSSRKYYPSERISRKPYKAPMSLRSAIRRMLRASRCVANKGKISLSKKIVSLKEHMYQFRKDQNYD